MKGPSRGTKDTAFGTDANGFAGRMGMAEAVWPPLGQIRTGLQGTGLERVVKVTTSEYKFCEHGVM